MTILASFSLAVSLATSSGMTCDNSGITDFFDTGNGFTYLSYRGQDSNSAFFVGKEFHQLESKEGLSQSSGQLHFSIDGNFYQLSIVDRNQYSQSSANLSDEQNLEAQYIYEYGYLKGLGDKGFIKLGDVQNYGIVTMVDGDKLERKYYIWSANINGGLQLFVTTSIASGVQLLSSIVPDGDINKTKATLDNYMYSFRLLRGTECVRKPPNGITPAQTASPPNNPH